MNVARYIGLFLLKNDECYISGLGTLRLIRKPARFDGHSLHAASCDITISPGGSVDDSLANYIATNEQISISKASAALKEFTTHTQEAIAEDKEVTLAHLGKFSEVNGMLTFITDPHLQFTPEPIMAQKGVPERAAATVTPVFTQAQQPYPAGSEQPMPHEHTEATPPSEFEEKKSSKVHWGRIIVLLVLLLLLAASAFYAYNKFLTPRKVQTKPLEGVEFNMDEEGNGNDGINDANEQIPPPATDTITDESIMMGDDEMQEVVPEEPVSAQPKQQKPAVQKPVQQQPPATAKPKEKTIKFKAVINTYDRLDDAQKRKRTLEAYGNKAEVIREDTNYYFVVMPVETTEAKKKRVLDSLSNKFNNEGVFIY